MLYFWVHLHYLKISQEPCKYLLFSAVLFYVTVKGMSLDSVLLIKQKQKMSPLT